MNKRIVLFSVFVLLASLSFAQKYATGRWAKLIHKKYVQGEEPVELKGFTWYMGTMLTLDTPALKLSFYKRKSTHLLVMALEEKGINTITDVVEVAGVQRNQQFLISQCSIGSQSPSPDLIVLAENPPARSLKAKPLKAWRANRDKIHFSKIPVRQLICLFEDP